MRTHKLKILMVEDDPNDVLFVRHALERGQEGHSAYFVENGNEAISYLMGEGKYGDRSEYPLPNIIITDLKMPKLDGLGFLKWLRTHSEQAVIPTIVMSSSGQESDIRGAYQLGAHSYIIKPSSVKELITLLHIIWQYWCHCERPSIADSSEGREES